MKIIELYTKLIQRARTRDVSGYVEWHHVVPRALGGLDVPNNLVALTAKEHYIAHLLLWRMLPCFETATAFMFMSRRLSIRGREYERAKIEFSKNNPSKTPEGRARLRAQRLGTITSAETRLKQSWLKLGKPNPKNAERLKGTTNPRHANWMKGQTYAAKPIIGFKDGETRTWASITEFAKEFGVASNTPSEAIRLNRPCKGWKLEKQIAHRGE